MSPVKIYTKPNCPQCRYTKKRIEDRNISFVEIDITEDPDGMHRVKNELGYKQAPVVVVKDGEMDMVHWSGFSPDKIDAIQG